MKTRRIISILVLFGALWYPSPSSRAQGLPAEAEFVPGELLVKLKEKPSTPPEGVKASPALPEAPEQTLTRLWTELQVEQQIKEVEPVFARAADQVTIRRQAVLGSPDRLGQIRSKFPARTKRIPKGAIPPRLDRIFKITLDNEQADVVGVARRLSAHPEVEYAEPNLIMHALKTPNDPFFQSRGSWGQDFDDLWGLKKIQMPSAWDTSTGSQEIIVAVIDTGIDYHHPDLAANMWFNLKEIAGNGVDDDRNGFVDDVRGWDFDGDDNDPMDGNAHGTHVSGTIGAIANNRQGVAGINWNVRLMALKGLSDAGSGGIGGLAKAIVYAADNGADVLSNSWGGSGSSSTLEDAVNYAHSLGAVVVAAAGNDNTDASGFTPANIKNVITVSAFDHRDKKASFSNFGTKIDVAAPGVDVLSTVTTFLEAPLVSQLNVLSDNNRHVSSRPLEFSAKTSSNGLRALVLDAKLGRSADFQGQDFRGKLALIKRGELTFADKVKNAAAAGAAGAIIFNHESGNFAGTLGDPSTIPAVSIALEDGQYLLGLLQAGPTEALMVVATSAEYYDHFSGTSMACPHVSGLAALILAHNPTFTNEQVRTVLRISSDDIVNPVDDQRSYPGFDIYSGYGRINAFRALQIRPGPIEAVPVAKFLTPAQGALVSGLVEVSGTATGPRLQRWVLEYGQGETPSQWVKIAEATAAVEADVLGTWDTRRLPYGLYTLRLQVHDATFSTPVEDRVTLSVTFSLQEGWPQPTGGLVISSPALGDLNQDGRREVVVGSYDKKVYAWRSDGTLMPGWPKDTTGNVASSPVLVDLDGTPGLEVLVGSNDGKIYAWRADGTLVAGWPQSAQGAVFSSPAAADLDGDGRVEVVVGSYDHRVYAWRRDGTMLPGWPQETGGPIVSSPALADLNQDGTPEVIVGSTDRKLHVWRADGTPLPGWPKPANGPIVSSPAVGDVDGDGTPEIVCGSNDHKVYVWKKDGSVLSGWPQSTGGAVESSPALGDLDQDGRLEVVVGSHDKKVYAWRSNGTLLPGWPRATTGFVVASPTLLDLDTDGFLDIVVGSLDKSVYAWRVDGRLVEGWPLVLSDAVESSASFADLDADGDLELAVGSLDHQVTVLDLETGVEPGAARWAMFKKDIARAGVAELILEADGSNGLLIFRVRASDLDGDALTFSASGLPQGATFNPATQVFRWQPTPAQRGVHQVTFTVTDGTRSTSETVTITVVGNRLPRLSPIGNQEVFEGRLLEFVLRATDPDGDALTFRSPNLPQGASLDPAAGQFQWRPDQEQAGVYPRVRFEVTDGTGVDAREITITVRDASSDTTPPARPQLDPVPSPTRMRSVLLTGTKEAGSSVVINGITVVPLTSATNWSARVRLIEGANPLTITSQDAAGNTSAPVTLTIVLDTVAPTVRITSPQQGGKIRLP